MSVVAHESFELAFAHPIHQFLNLSSVQILKLCFVNLRQHDIVEGSEAVEQGEVREAADVKTLIPLLLHSINALTIGSASSCLSRDVNWRLIPLQHDLEHNIRGVTQRLELLAIDYLAPKVYSLIDILNGRGREQVAAPVLLLS